MAGLLDFDPSQGVTPTQMGLLGLLSGLGQASAPSRLPVTTGMVIGDAAGGFANGYGAGLANQGQQLKNQMAQYGLYAAQQRMKMLQDALGGTGAFGSQSSSATPSAAPSASPSMTPQQAASVALSNGKGPTVQNAATMNGLLASHAAPSVGGTGYAPPSAPTGSVAGIPVSVVRQAVVADLLTPGAGKEIMSKAFPGPTDAQRALVAAGVDPNSPTGRSLLFGAAAKAAGYGPMNVRQGGAVVNPLTGQLIFQNPRLGLGVRLDDQGNAEKVPHYIEAALPVETMQHGAAAQFEPQEGVTPNGTPYTTNRLAIAPPAVQRMFGYGASPAAPPAAPAPQPAPPVAAPPIAPPAAPAVPPAAAPNAPAPTQGAIPPGTIQSGLSPKVEEAQKARGKELEDYGQSLIDQASSAKNQQFIIDRMRAESGNGSGWTPNAFAEWKGAAEKLMNGLDPTHKAFSGTLSNYQAFVKNAMNLTTQATRAVSSRAAVQEMQMIREALPNPTMSAGALHNIFDQFSAVNDYSIAKENAANAWRTRPGGDGTLSGFETMWNQNVSPSAFLVHRMSPEDLQTMAANLGKTAQGRTVLKKIVGEVQYAQNNGLFQDGQ